MIGKLHGRILRVWVFFQGKIVLITFEKASGALVQHLRLRVGVQHYVVAEKFMGFNFTIFQ